MDKQDFSRFFQSTNEFNTLEPIGSIYEKVHSSKNKFGSKASKSKSKHKLVKLICYCLNPNHYHFLLQQVADKGIEKFMQRLGTGYTKYFNNRHKRNGVLFQDKFKAVHIDTNEQLLHVSVYVNLNYKIHLFGSKASKCLSSWNEYTTEIKHNFCEKDDILGQFKNRSEYEKFARRNIDGILERKELLKEMEE